MVTGSTTSPSSAPACGRSATSAPPSATTASLRVRARAPGPPSCPWRATGTATAIDGIGTYRYADGSWSLRDAASAGAPDIGPFTFWAGAGSYPVVGDWDADKSDTVGVKLGIGWSLRNANSAGAAEVVFDYGDVNNLPLSWRMACGPGIADAPDPLFLDTNCDGIDGDATQAVFVAPSGNDVNPGTRALPKRTLAAANALADAATPKKDVYAAAGSYAETLVVRDGVGVYGAYSGADWSRSASNVTSITMTTATSGRVEAALAQNVAATTELQYLRLTAGPATSPATSTYGLRAVNSPGLVLDRLTISAGNAGAGAAGSTGAAGATGGAGTDGGAGACDALISASGGSGGTQSEGRNGGAGGGGGRGSASGLSGQSGVGGTSGGSGGASGDPGAAGTPGMVGSNASTGPNGFGGSGGSVVANAWTSAAGGGGGVGGLASGGGGGGGGGGQFGSFVVAGTGNGGGGGGAAGLRGAAGGGGGSSGGSFGLFISNSSGMTVRNSSVSSGNGGAGGAGGAGGNGGLGGAGGFRGATCTGEVGSGGNGGKGGNGARGGHGGGGAGGPSFAIYRVNSAGVVLSGNALVAGFGGAGGSSAGNVGTAGASGAVF